MHFATRVKTWRVARLYSEIAVSRKPFRIEHMYVYTCLLGMTDIMTSQNIDLSSWDTLYSLVTDSFERKIIHKQNVLGELIANFPLVQHEPHRKRNN
jgi:hypothetical protein